MGPVRWSELWLKLAGKILSLLNCCERKTLFRLKKPAEQAKFKTSERGPDLGVHFMISVSSSTYAYEIRTHYLYFIYCYGLCCYVDYDIFFVTLNQYFFL